MLFHTIKAICISLLLIVLIHYLYFFLKDTLTVPKIKDLVNKPAKRYDEMFEIMTNNRSMQGPTSMQDQGMQELTSMQGQGMQELTSMQGQGIQGQDMQKPISMPGQGMQGPTSLQKPTSMQEELNNFLNELKKPGENSVNMSNKFPSAILENSLSFPTANDLSSGAYAPY